MHLQRLYPWPSHRLSPARNFVPLTRGRRNKLETLAAKLLRPYQAIVPASRQCDCVCETAQKESPFPCIERDCKDQVNEGRGGPHLGRRGRGNKTLSRGTY